jgi:biuret amidohydrolase
MSRTVAHTTPYAWPWDGAFAPSRTALLVVSAPGAPVPGAGVETLAGALRHAGGVVVQVTTAPPRATGALVAETWGSADERVGSAGVDGFYGSALDGLLRSRGRDQLLLAGAWLETGVHSTMRSANDRGYECLLVLDACTAYDPDLVAASRSQIEMSGGIFGAVGTTDDVLAAVAASLPTERTPA